MTDSTRDRAESVQEDLQIKAVFEQKIVRDLLTECERKRIAWRNTCLNVCVIGSAGGGKSTLINILRRVKPLDPFAAPTGAVQTTMEATPYEYPGNPLVKFWDQPSIGTRGFSKEYYAELIKSGKFDVYILISYTRFKEDDIWLALKIRDAAKPFIFARTKIDVDVRNYRYDYPGSHVQGAEKLLKRVRDDCAENLSAAGITDSTAFLICRNPLLYDFPALVDKLITSLRNDVMEAALLTLWSTSKNIIKQKTALLRQRVWAVAAASGAAASRAASSVAVTQKASASVAVAHWVPASVAAAPSVGASGAAAPVSGSRSMFELDSGIIWDELMLYEKVYGLDKEGLKQLSEWAGVRVEMLSNVIKENFWTNLTADGLLQILCSYAAAAEDRNKGIPSIAREDNLMSFAFSGGSYFLAAERFLNHSIEIMEKAILEVISIATSRASTMAQ